MRYLKYFESLYQLKRDDIPPIIDVADHGGDGDENYGSYTQEWLDYWGDREYPSLFSEIWRDEKYRKGLNNYKETQAYRFYSKLWDDHRFDYSFLKDDIENEITKFIDDYNKSVYELDRVRAINKEIEDIMNEYEVTLDGKKVTYKLEKPEKALVNKLMKHGNSEEEANKKLFTLISIEDIYDPNNIPDNDEWMKKTYIPFVEDYIEPFVDKKGWRIWSI